MIFKTFVVVALLAVANARPNCRAASCTFPAPLSTSSLSSSKTIEAGESFDAHPLGGNVRFDRGSGACEGQTEEGDAAAVFLLEEGTTLSNVVIGNRSSRGYSLSRIVHVDQWNSSAYKFKMNAYSYQHFAVVEDVCESILLTNRSRTRSPLNESQKPPPSQEEVPKALTTRSSSTMEVEDFVRSSLTWCEFAQHSTFSNIIASSGSTLAGINFNYGDTAIFDTDTIGTDDVDSICDTYEGNDTGDEPTKLTSNTSNDYCQF
ncbi:uncharacterized protein BT62DRAFT_915502 [Guyanagaster necrorhizus]|uniref:Pectate lyase n=1 Tax=Guyanagaster necrorhizus TaxID=856835 RepID=A0A9P7W8D2_9AGAR|nr:uncharacterized protein BT62DRAFT_915502 [Guyanagaster necrorhizus MCA 3950]KAG7453221.1 hypothetical protein BT62DRAFT_915502 [Guyanagaster necrorhizus MCA 3950]